MSRVDGRYLLVFVFVIGTGSLGAEIAAARLMAPFFGASTIVWANTIGVVLAALSLGYWLGGKLADRRPELRALCLMVLAAAIMLAVIPFVALSYGAVWLITTKLLHTGGPTISPGETAWYAAFKRMLPADHGAYVTVELRDGRALAGLVAAYTPDADEPREILLSRPVDGTLWVRDAQENAEALPDSFIVLQSPDIIAISGRYTPEAAAEVATPN